MALWVSQHKAFLDRWGGVANHRVIVWRGAVALQLRIQGRIFQAEVQ